MLALAPSTVPKYLPAWIRESLLWLLSDLSLGCRKRGKGQICVGIRKRLLSEPLVESECTALQAILGLPSAKMCLQNHSSLWRQQQKVHCCSYTPSGMLYKTEKETSGRVNITSPTHCCMHNENHLFLLMDEKKSHGIGEEQGKKM